MTRKCAIPFGRTFTRNVSDYIYFNVNYADTSPTAYYNLKADNLANHSSRKYNARLKVPLLKSAQYFGHFSSRVNRFTNEDNYSALVLNLPFNKFNSQVDQLLLQRFTNKESQKLLENFQNNKDLNGNIEGLQVFNFNVFDGHGGDKISKFLSQNLSKYVETFSQHDFSKKHLHDLISKYDEYFRPTKENNKKSKFGGIYWRRWLRNLNKNYDKVMRDSHGQLDDLPMRLLYSYLQMDYDLMTKHLVEVDTKNKNDTSPPPGGSTATSIFIYNLIANNSNNMYFDDQSVAKLTISHLGDTKCLLVDKFGTAHALTSDHHPDSPIENMRLTKYSSDFFVNVDSFGEERFLNFANTRSFGDFNAKAKGITAEPEVRSLLIGNSSFINKQSNSAELINQTVSGIGGDECFLMLVSDGVTNYCSDQEMADIIMANYNMRGAEAGTTQNGAEELVHYVETIGGDDNATCLVIRLNGWGKWPMIDRTGKLREEKLNDAVFSRRRDAL